MTKIVSLRPQREILADLITTTFHEIRQLANEAIDTAEDRCLKELQRLLPQGERKATR